MDKISLNYKNGNIKIDEINKYDQRVKDIHKKMHNKESEGNEYIGWLDYPENYNRAEIERIKKAAAKITADTEVMIVIGIGGSYLGAKAVIDALGHSFCDMLEEAGKKYPHILFAGNNLSSTYLCQLLEAIEGKDISLNVISKSGTTTEPAVAFRLLKDYMYEKYGEKAKERIYVTTDGEHGNLRTLALKEGYELFTVPGDIGGRYSVLTPVGLLPIAVGGANLDKLLEGAKDSMEKYNNDDLNENDCYKYAVIRNILYDRDKQVEFLITYEPSLKSFSEWFMQLFGESEGKGGKGLIPMALSYTTDLHSMGQLIQDGTRSMFETTINIETPRRDISIKNQDDDLDDLNYLTGKSIDYINKKAMEGVIKAHVDGGVPNLMINVPKVNSYYMGGLIYFFEKACAMSGYILGVNPFNQPGVETYKKNMFELLGK